MKIFKFDPATGKRGDSIDAKRLVCWTSCYLQYALEHKMIEPIEWVQPKDFGDNVFTTHVEAGCDDEQGKPIVYNMDDQWITFCLGLTYPGGLDKCKWTWVILPPRNLLKFITYRGAK